jgi:hypothetical protein
MISKYLLPIHLIRSFILVMLLWITIGGANISAEIHPMYEFKPLFMPHNELIEYTITSLQKEMNGEASISIRKIKQLDMDVLLVRYDGTEGKTGKEKWEAKLKYSDLTPVTFDRTLDQGENSMQVNGSFSGETITINLRSTGQDPREILFSRGSKFHLSMMVPYLLRNIDCVTGDWYTFNMLVVEDGRFTTPIIQIKEKEVIECPAGLYDCWKVSIKIGENQHWAWYSVKEPHYLIRYQYPDKELVMKRHS